MSLCVNPPNGNNLQNLFSIQATCPEFQFQVERELREAVSTLHTSFKTLHFLMHTSTKTFAQSLPNLKLTPRLLSFCCWWTPSAIALVNSLEEREHMLFRCFYWSLQKILYKYHHSTKLYWKISWVCCRLYCYECAERVIIQMAINRWYSFQHSSVLWWWFYHINFIACSDAHVICSTWYGLSCDL